MHVFWCRIYLAQTQCALWIQHPSAYWCSRCLWWTQVGPKIRQVLAPDHEGTIVWTGKATLDVVNFSSFHSPDQYEYQDHQASSTKAQSCYPRAKRLQAHSRKHEGGSQCTRPSHPRKTQWGRPGRTLVSQNVQSVSEGLSMFGSEKISHISSESAQT